MKKIFLLLLITLASKAYSQEKFTRYLNEKWFPVPKADAIYEVEYVKKDSLYHVTSYFIHSKKMQGYGSFADTGFNNPRNISVSFDEKGTIKDSSFYLPNGNAKYRYIYYPNGKLRTYFIGYADGSEKESKGFDESGKEIEGFIFEKEASFPGGSSEWIAYISKNIKSKVPVKKRAPKAVYNVVIRFIVDRNGQVTDAVAETNHGYGMEEEALRVINKSPKWNNAVQFNRPVNAYRRQPVTFVVQ